MLSITAPIPGLAHPLPTLVLSVPAHSAPHEIHSQILAAALTSTRQYIVHYNNYARSFQILAFCHRDVGKVIPRLTEIKHIQVSLSLKKYPILKNRRPMSQLIYPNLLYLISSEYSNSDKYT
jgi:hypothetical protein